MKYIQTNDESCVFKLNEAGLTKIIAIVNKEDIGFLKEFWPFVEIDSYNEDELFSMREWLNNLLKHDDAEKFFYSVFQDNSENVKKSRKGILTCLKYFFEKCYKDVNGLYADLNSIFDLLEKHTLENSLKRVLKAMKAYHKTYDNVNIAEIYNILRVKYEI